MRQIAIVEFFFVIIALSPLFQLKFQSPTRAPLQKAAIGRAVNGQEPEACCFDGETLGCG